MGVCTLVIGKYCDLALTALRYGTKTSQSFQHNASNI